MQDKSPTSPSQSMETARIDLFGELQLIRHMIGLIEVSCHHKTKILEGNQDQVLHKAQTAYRKVSTEVYKNIWKSEKSDSELAKSIAELRNLVEPPLRQFIERQRQFDPSRVTVHDHTGIAEHDQDGLLPPGLYHATWDEFALRFSTTERRAKQVQALITALTLLRDADCREVRIGGSFVTAKINPADIDLCWLEEGVNKDKLDPMLLDNPQMLRREYFGLDTNQGKFEKLQRRTIWRGVDLINFPNDLFGQGWLQETRIVGVIVLDLTQALPRALGFGSLWPA